MRHRIGLENDDRRLQGGVNIDEIPFLEEPYLIEGVSKWGLIGDAPKDFIVSPGRSWVAKGPRREGPIECVTEYLIARIGTLLPLRVAEGRLVRLRPRVKLKARRTTGDAVPDVRFLSRHFLDLRNGEQLVHGSQLVARCFGLGEGELFKQVPKGQEPEFYTVDLVAGVLGELVATKAHGDQLVASFARMITYDAIIGSNDRHAQNWGVVQSAVRRDSPVRFSPVFDTARGLFWNNSEDKLAAMEREGMERHVELYAGRSRPLIGIDGLKKPNHFDVVGRMIQDERFRWPVRQVISAFVPDNVTKLLRVEFGRLLSRRRLAFIDALLRYRHARLMALGGSD